MVILIGAHHCFSIFCRFQPGTQIIIRQSIRREIPVFSRHSGIYTIIIAIPHHCTDLMILDTCREICYPFQIVSRTFVEVTAGFSGDTIIYVRTISRRCKPSVKFINLILRNSDLRLQYHVRILRIKQRQQINGSRSIPFQQLNFRTILFFIQLLYDIRTFRSTGKTIVPISRFRIINRHCRIVFNSIAIYIG